MEGESTTNDDKERTVQAADDYKKVQGERKISCRVPCICWQKSDKPQSAETCHQLRTTLHSVDHWPQQKLNLQRHIEVGGRPHKGSCHNNDLFQWPRTSCHGCSPEHVNDTKQSLLLLFDAAPLGAQTAWAASCIRRE
mmetsp:Transcript_10588/g.23119  ORF Transcript_10588/g.23119 Transcript_10588/m.23119 type:complete len:138 (-) Transcript_10588:1584-1997(-)